MLFAHRLAPGAKFWSVRATLSPAGRRISKQHLPSISEIWELAGRMRRRFHAMQSTMTSPCQFANRDPAVPPFTRIARKDGGLGYYANDARLHLYVYRCFRLHSALTGSGSRILNILPPWARHEPCLCMVDRFGGGLAVFTAINVCIRSLNGGVATVSRRRQARQQKLSSLGWPSTSGAFFSMPSPAVLGIDSSFSNPPTGGYCKVKLTPFQLHPYFWGKTTWD